MSIQAIFGLPGQGKTTLLAKCAYKCLRGETFLGVPPHSKVFTNFECPGCFELDFDTLGLYAYEDALILIDEIMLLADTRDFKNFPAHLKFFFCMHRHFNLDIVYASQYWSDCDKKIRVLTDNYYLLEAAPFFPISFVKPINRKMSAENNNMVDNYTLGAPISWKWVWRPKYYKLFDSFASDRELKPLNAKLWAPAKFDARPFKDRFFDLSGSPVLRALRLFRPAAVRFFDFSRSPVLAAFRRIASRIVTAHQAADDLTLSGIASADQAVAADDLTQPAEDDLTQPDAEEFTEPVSWI